MGFSQGMASSLKQNRNLIARHRWSRDHRNQIGIKTPSAQIAPEEKSREQLREEAKILQKMKLVSKNRDQKEMLSWLAFVIIPWMTVIAYFYFRA